MGLPGRQILWQAHSLCPLAMSGNKEQVGTLRSPLCPAALERHRHPVTLLTVPQPPPQASLLDSKGGHQKSVQTPPHALQLHPSHFTPCFKLYKSWKLAMPFTCQRSAENFAQKARVFQDLFAELWEIHWLLPRVFSVDNCPSSTAPGSRHTFNSFSHVKQAILPLLFLSGPCPTPVLSPSLPNSNS